MENEVAKAPAYQVRVIEEKQELDAKLEKLKAFLGGPVEIEKEALNLLKQQESAMDVYSRVLGERIKLFA